MTQNRVKHKIFFIVLERGARIKYSSVMQHHLSFLNILIRPLTFCMTVRIKWQDTWDLNNRLWHIIVMVFHTTSRYSLCTQPTMHLWWAEVFLLSWCSLPQTGSASTPRWQKPHFISFSASIRSSCCWNGNPHFVKFVTQTHTRTISKTVFKQ